MTLHAAMKSTVQSVIRAMVSNDSSGSLMLARTCSITGLAAENSARMIALPSR